MDALIFKVLIHSKDDMYYICIICMWLRWDFGQMFLGYCVRFKIFIIFYNSSTKR